MLKKIRKKGSVFIEYLVVLPLFILCIWTILQIIVYMYANNQVDHAADSGAIFVSQQIRGHDGPFTTFGTEAEREQLGQELYSRINQSLSDNGFILYSENSDGTPKAASNFLPVITDKNQCDVMLKSSTDKEGLCILTESITNNGREHNQIVVRVKVPFNIIGNFVPELQGKVMLYGNGVSTVEIAGRYQYY